MEVSNTKQEILNAALNLFSTQGYEATSVLQIADKVGIRKSSIYSHFSSKKEILDSLMNNILHQYEKHSIFNCTDWNDPDFTKDKQNMTPDMAVQMIIKHVLYILHDPVISKARKMLTIEQFQNQQMSQVQTKQNYADVMKYFIGYMNFLIRCGKLSQGDPEIMAAQFCLPISVWINLCDREPNRESEVINLIEKHVRQFFDLYKKES